MHLNHNDFPNISSVSEWQPDSLSVPTLNSVQGMDVAAGASVEKNETKLADAASAFIGCVYLSALISVSHG